MTVLVICVVLAGLVIGLLVGVLCGHVLLLPSDRRRLEVMSQAMVAEQRVDDMTRSTIQAMRDATRRQA